MALALPGCGDSGGSGDDASDKGGRPEEVTAYEAVQFCRDAATKWREKNWNIVVKDGAVNGLSEKGKAEVWQVYFFSPTPEINGQYQIQYNRGYIWPSVPSETRGGEEGKKIYTENEPKNFRVDSPEALVIANRNGGKQYLDENEGAKAHASLRCKADYDAVGQSIIAPKSIWIWEITYSVSGSGTGALKVYVDGMTGDFLNREQL